MEYKKLGKTDMRVSSIGFGTAFRGGITPGKAGVLRRAVELGINFFDSAEAELASSSSAALELETAPLLRLRGVPRIQLLRSLRREVEIAGRFGVALVASSGAVDEYQMRAPQDYAALATLFDLPLPSGLQALSDNPWSIVERNRGKLSPDFVAPGIRVVRKR